MTRVDPARIKQARLESNHSQETLGRAIGTSGQNILRWEHGKHRPRVEWLAAIAIATDKPLTFFFVDDEAGSEALEERVDGRSRERRAS